MLASFAYYSASTLVPGNVISTKVPASTALLIANIAFGVMSRAAPTLNLFAVGLPAGLMIGFVVLLLNISHLSALLTEFLQATLVAITAMLSA